MRIVLIVGTVATVLATAACGSSRATDANGKILFGRSTDLYAMNADGSQARLFLRNAGYPAVSRDGQWVAFVRDSAIWIVRRDGTAPRQITTRPRRIHDLEPAWSADGRTIFFSRRKEPEGGYESIFSVSLDGRDLRRLTFSDVEWDCAEMEPAPFPDGRIVAYTDYCDRGATASILAISPSGRDRDLGLDLGDNFWSEYAPAWSPDGASLAFAAEHPDEYGNAPIDLGSRLAIYVASSTKPPHAVARPSGTADGLRDPAWSPDGTWIALTRATGTKASELWLVHPDGTGLRQLTDGTPADSNPEWLPPVQ